MSLMISASYISVGLYGWTDEISLPVACYCACCAGISTSHPPGGGAAALSAGEYSLCSDNVTTL